MATLGTTKIAFELDGIRGEIDKALKSLPLETQVRALHPEWSDDLVTMVADKIRAHRSEPLAEVRYTAGVVGLR